MQSRVDQNRRMKRANIVSQFPQIFEQLHNIGTKSLSREQESCESAQLMIYFQKMANVVISRTSFNHKFLTNEFQVENLLL